MAATDDAETVRQAVEALREAILTQDKETLETLAAEQLSYSHSDAHLEDKSKFINAIMTRKTVLKSLDFPDLTVAIVGNDAIVRHLWVSKANSTATLPIDRRPAGMPEAGQRLEVVGACVLHLAATLMITSKDP
ncbi:MAG: nuclear transport factor 2 family protein [Acetobacteraceae bacterium]|nr:nuclear transport factor 2 family protein [Acetobacteraceae bacterium]